MTEALWQAVERAAHDAERLAGPKARDAGLAVGAWLLVLSAAGRAPGRDERAKALGPLVRGAVQNAREEALRRPELREELLACAELAEAGLDGLGAEPTWGTLPRDLLLPSPHRLRRALSARLDAFRAARACVRARAEGEPLEALTDATDVPPVVRLAAAGARPLRDPSEGTTLDVIPGLPAELVWFAAERELAIYAGDSSPIQVVGAGFETVDMKPGYWLGRVAPGAARARVRLGEHEGSLELP
ncbi:MAG: hypothetical protein AAGH15_16820 [Myxococcota bacterium]